MLNVLPRIAEAKVILNSVHRVLGTVTLQGSLWDFVVLSYYYNLVSLHSCSEWQPGMIEKKKFSSVLNIETNIILKQQKELYHFPSVQSLSRVWLFATPWTATCQASLSITNSRSLPKPMSIKSVMPSNHLILCHPLLLLPSIFPSIKVFPKESALCIRWPKYWSFTFNISPSNEYSGPISFRMHWLDLLAVQGTLKSLLQHHSSKASILRCSAFFI